MPAYVIEAWSGVAEVGSYAAVLSVLYISEVLNTTLGAAAIARLARLFEADRRGFLALLGPLPQANRGPEGGDEHMEERFGS